MKPKNDWKIILIAILASSIVTMLVVVPAAVFVTWYFAKSKIENDNKKTVSKLRNQIMDLTEKSVENDEPVVGSSKNEDSSTVENETPSQTGEGEWQDYKNKRFSFQIGYPSDYASKESNNGDGVTLTKGKSKILAYGAYDDSKSIDGYISKNFPEAKNKDIFVNDKAKGKIFFDETDNKYIVFKTSGTFIVIMSEYPDEATSSLVEDIAFTFAPL